MKTLKISILCVIFLFTSFTANLFAQTNNEDEFYYSNPKKGINANPPKPYNDTSVVKKSNDITVELIGESMDSITNDTTAFAASDYYDYAYAARINRFHRGMCFDYFDAHYTDLYWYTGNPLYWGTSIYYAWDPWYSPWWNSWYYPGWGGSFWHITYPWGWGPYWSFGYGPAWSYGWGGAYAWTHIGYYGGWNGQNGSFGHHYIGNNRSASNPTYRNTTGNNPSPIQRGTVRQGGVDRNNGNVRYNKPQSVTSRRNQQTSARTTANNRSAYETPRNGRFDNNTHNSRNSTLSSDRQTPSSRNNNFENNSRQTSRNPHFDNVRSNNNNSRSSSFGTSSGRSGGFGGGSVSHGSGSRGGSSSSRR